MAQEDQQGHSKPVVAHQGLREDHHPEALAEAAHGTSLGTDEVGTHEIWIKDPVAGQLLRDSWVRERQNQEVATSGPTHPEEAQRAEAASRGHQIVEATWEEVQNARSQEAKLSILERPQAGKLDTAIPIEFPEPQRPTTLLAGTVAGEPIPATTAKDAATARSSTTPTTLRPHQSLEDVVAHKTTSRATGRTAEGSDTDSINLIISIN